MAGPRSSSFAFANNGRQRHRQGYGFTLTQANLRSARSLNILTALGFIQRENDTRGAYKGTVVTILH